MRSAVFGPAGRSRQKALSGLEWASICNAMGESTVETAAQIRRTAWRTGISKTEGSRRGGANGLISRGYPRVNVCDANATQFSGATGTRSYMTGHAGAQSLARLGRLFSNLHRDASGVRTRARAGGRERRNQGHKRREMGAGEPGGGEPPRRLSGGECGGSEGGRVEHTDGDASSGPDTSARGSAEAGDSEARTGRCGTRSGGADDERSESDGTRDAMLPEATSRANT